MSEPTPKSPQQPAAGGDLLSSVVVFLVALPLCLGIALASGADPVSGLLTGIIGGILVGCISGSPLQVSGPAAGLVTIVAGIIYGHDLGLTPTEANPRPGLAYIGIILFLAGVVQMLAGLLRFGTWFRAVPPAVILGMLAGIGVLIVGSQVQVLIDDEPHAEGLHNLLHLHEAFLVAIGIHQVPTPTHSRMALLLGLVTIAVTLLWKPLAPKALKFLPGALIGIAAATALAALLSAHVHYVKIPANLLDGIRLPSPDVWQMLISAEGWRTMMPAIIGAALTIALVASAETLLCAAAVDQMHNGKRTKYNQELFAQGVGNTLCGLVGALPMTGVIVRSAANVEAGARTRLSAILHGVWLLGLVALLPFVLRLIPTSALAGILILTGLKLAHPKAVLQLAASGKGEVVIYLATLIGVVATDLLKGVGIGFALALIKLMWTFLHLSIRVEQVDGRTILHLKGAATFIRLPRLAAALEAVPPNTELHVRLEELTYIDHACLELFINWERQHEATGGSLVIDWDSLTARFR